MIGRHNRDYRQCGQLTGVKLAGEQSALLSDQGEVDFSFSQSNDLLTGSKVQRTRLANCTADRVPDSVVSFGPPRRWA